MNYADMIVPGSRKNIVSINFIVHLLKSKAKQIGNYKKAMKKNIVYFGDLIEEHLMADTSSGK
jgi:hypothetical protein